MKSITGVLLIAVGIFCVYWAETHSPRNVGKIIENTLTGSYTLSEPWYYVCLGFGILIGIVGVLRTYKFMK